MKHSYTYLVSQAVQPFANITLNFRNRLQPKRDLIRSLVSKKNRDVKSFLNFL
jgi:hypothetical protein